MGTFRIIPTQVTAGDSPFIDANDGNPHFGFFWAVTGSGTDNNDATILIALQSPINTSFNFQWDCGTDAVFFPPPLNATRNLRLGFTGDCIFLDGSLIPISFAGIPAGFTPLTASVLITIDDVLILPDPLGSTTFYKLELENGNLGTINTPSYSYDFTPPFQPTMADIIANGMGLQCTSGIGVVDTLGFVGLIYNMRIEGTYEIQQFQFKLPTISSTDELVESGSPIVIASVPLLPQPPPPPDPPTDDDSILNLLGVTQININYSCSGVPTTTIIPSSAFIVFTWYTITFDLPTLDCDPSFVEIELVVAGTQFTGSVILGNMLTIFFTNGTGIYTLVPGKSSDTLYVQDYDPVVEVDVKIPNPFAKTGFIGG